MSKSKMICLWFRLSLIVCFGSVFHLAMEINYNDIVMHAMQRDQTRKQIDEEQTLARNLNLKLSKSHLGSVSPWKILLIGAQLMKSQAQGDDSAEACLNSTMDTVMALSKGEVWAITMIDATGKLESGVLKGNVKWLGSMSECEEIEAIKTLSDNTTRKLFNGQYCVVALSPTNSSSIFKNPMGNVVIDIGMCVPSTCSRDNVKDFISFSISSLTNGSLKAEISQFKPKSLPLSISARVMIVLLSVIGAVILIGTTYDIFIYQPSVEKEKSRLVVVAAESSNASGSGERNQHLTPDEFTPLLQGNREENKVVRQEQPNNLAKVLLAFSIFSNGRKLLNTDRPQGSVGCVHGLRFFSMTWVILGHVCIYGAAFGKNPLDVIEWTRRWTFQAIDNATVSVDTFFTLSGTLVSFLLLKELQNKNGPRNVNWAMFYFHRFWRLTPMYMLVLGTYVTLFAYWGDGPQWPHEKGLDPNCNQYWWTNLLYINNFVSQGKQCMLWSWYLANDMQFFILSPFIVVAFYYKWYAGLMISSVMLLTCFVSTSIIVVKHGYLTGLTDLLKPGQQHWFDDIYLKPWCRIGPYIVGIMTGYLLNITEKQKPEIPKSVVILGWSFATACYLAVIYGLVDYAQGATIATGLSAFYDACSRTAWAVGVAWVMFACSRGYGGFVNTILSWPALVPLSRLTYAAYLVHPVVLMYYTLELEDPFLFTEITFIWLFLGSLVVSYAVAFITSLAFEAPMMALEKVVFKRN